MLKRREFCELSLLAGLAGVAGCSRGVSSPILCAASEALPKELLGALPYPWEISGLRGPITQTPFPNCFQCKC